MTAVQKSIYTFLRGRGLQAWCALDIARKYKPLPPLAESFPLLLTPQCDDCGRDADVCACDYERSDDSCAALELRDL